MTEGRVIRLLATFIVVVVVIVVGTAILGFATGGLSGPAGEAPPRGQSPSHFQPDAVNPAIDPESGEITIATDGEGKSILVDEEHGNEFTATELEPIEEALFRAGHSLNYSSNSDGSYNETLAAHDALLIIQPTRSFTQAERNAIHEFVADGGRVLILAEPTQLRAGSGFFSSPSVESFAANRLAAAYGFRIGAEVLYNLDDESNDNNFKSIYASPTQQSQLSEGVENITFDTGGQVIVRDDSEADVLFTAATGTKTLQTRRTGTYPTVARNDSVVFIADSNFLIQNEVYDADNEAFVGNLLTFLLSGEKEESAPEPTPTEEPANETSMNGTENETALIGQPVRPG